MVTYQTKKGGLHITFFLRDHNNMFFENWLITVWNPREKGKIEIELYSTYSSKLSFMARWLMIGPSRNSKMYINGWPGYVAEKRIGTKKYKNIIRAWIITAALVFFFHRHVERFFSTKIKTRSREKNTPLYRTEEKLSVKKKFEGVPRSEGCTWEL